MELRGPQAHPTALEQTRLWGAASRQDTGVRSEVPVQCSLLGHVAGHLETEAAPVDCSQSAHRLLALEFPITGYSFQNTAHTQHTRARRGQPHFPQTPLLCDFQPLSLKDSALNQFLTFPGPRQSHTLVFAAFSPVRISPCHQDQLPMTALTMSDGSITVGRGPGRVMGTARSWGKALS